MDKIWVNHTVNVIHVSYISAMHLFDSTFNDIKESFIIKEEKIQTFISSEMYDSYNIQLGENEHILEPWMCKLIPLKKGE